MTELKRRGLMPLVVLCFATIWFVWGSTFLAIHWAIADMPPLAMCGLRLLLAGLLLLAWAVITRAPWPRGAEWRHAALVGVLLPAAGNGSVTLGTAHRPRASWRCCSPRSRSGWRCSLRSGRTPRRPHRARCSGSCSGSGASCC